MRIETKFGLGEIVWYSRHKSERGTKHDAFLEVIGMYIDKQGCKYQCRWPSGIVGAFDGSELENDPSYDQEGGYEDDPHPRND